MSVVEVAVAVAVVLALAVAVLVIVKNFVKVLLVVPRNAGRRYVSRRF